MVGKMSTKSLNVKQNNSSKSKLDLNDTDIWMTTTNRASIF